MTAKSTTVSKWQAIGSSRTSPVENQKRAQVLLDSYYIVVGFEVNNSKAFVDDVHDLAVDYGHAFFYLVKNVTIIKSLSFGPNGAGKIGWFNNGRYLTYKKDGSQNARPATADYPIRERARAFRIQVSIQQATSLQRAIDEIRVEIYYGRQEYSPIMNDTCAETAKEILDQAGVQTPSGAGWIKNSKMLSFPVVYAVNPYAWHANFKVAHPEKEFAPDEVGEWYIIVGENDPIFGVPGPAKK